MKKIKRFFQRHGKCEICGKFCTRSKVIVRECENTVDAERQALQEIYMENSQWHDTSLFHVACDKHDQMTEIFS
jgi:hypothetical protein